MFDLKTRALLYHTTSKKKITITNKIDSDTSIYVGVEESISNPLATIAPGQSQEVTLDGNIIYAGYPEPVSELRKYILVINGSPLGCAVNEVSGDFRNVYKIEITNSPASCSFSIYK